MRLKATLATALILAQLAVPTFPQARAAFPRESKTPPGQISVVTVNARQGMVLNKKRFDQLLELVRALRTRPEAFNGGKTGAVLLPDVIALQEISLSNLEILRRLMNQRFSTGHYGIVGATNAHAKFLINSKTIAVGGSPQAWPDQCARFRNPEGPPRTFQVVPLVESSTGTQFAVAGIYWSARYDTDSRTCRSRNIDALRAQLSTDLGPVFVVGDFNTRAVGTPHECDPGERSAPRDWWLAMTQPTAEGRAFTDAVKSHSGGMASEWTHEQQRPRDLCNGANQSKRSRIDYIFSDGAVVAEAHADKPAWAGEAPGTKHYSSSWYSDHRIVWGRFVIAGPPRPPRPSAAPRERGVIRLTWSPDEGGGGWVLYRATPGSAYRAVARLGPEATSYDDRRTDHDKRYRYSIAALGPDRGQGLESGGRWMRADARGPMVTVVDPPRGATGIAPRTRLKVHLGESAKPASVTQDSIRVFKDGRRVSGRVARTRSRQLTFSPARPLRKGQTYSAVVSGLRDRVGNLGTRFSWRFRTIEPRRNRN